MTIRLVCTYINKNHKNYQQGNHILNVNTQCYININSFIF
jgi:hypothetical protein